VTGLVVFPGSLQANAGEGPESGLDRRSTREAGLALTPVPSGAESSRRERCLFGCGWPCSPSSGVDGVAEPVIPVAGHPFATDMGGME
jgi:hypothetical protein